MANIQPRRDAIGTAREDFDRAVRAGTIPTGTPFHALVESSGDPNLPEQVRVILPPGVPEDTIAPVKFRGTVCDTPIVVLH